MSNDRCTECGAELWVREPATQAKHRLYRAYLDAWWPIMLQAGWDRVTYLDAFAGPGEYLGGEVGSPVIALSSLLEHTARAKMSISRKRVHAVYMERDRRRAEHLRKVLTRQFGSLEDLPVTVRVVPAASATTDIPAVLDDAGAWGNPVLSVLDSWGNVVVPIDVLSKLASNISSDVIVTMQPNWFQRRRSLDTELIDAVFGGRSHWEGKGHRTPTTFESWKAWLQAYKVALGSNGFAHQLAFEVRPATGQPLYLVFGTGHEKGVWVMKRAMWTVDRRDGLAFRDPRTTGAVPMDQLPLFGGPDAERVSPELRALVIDHLRSGPVTVANLRHWLLLDTAQWLPEHAAQVLSELRDDGKISLSPTGRITSNSTASLIG